MTVAHLSDLHWGFSAAHNAFIEQQLHQLEKGQPDHLVISGDLSQSGHPAEFAELVRLLRTSGFFSAERLTVIPGNHDLFTFFFNEFRAGRDFYAKLHKVPAAAFRLVRYGWKQYQADLDAFDQAFHKTFDNILTIRDEASLSHYPFIKVLNDHIALIALDSNQLLPQVRRNAVCSNGYVDPVSARRILSHPILQNKFKLVVLHHPLWPESVLAQRHGRWFAAMVKLRNRSEIVDLLSEFKVDLVLHGHYHVHENYTIEQYLHVLNSGDCEQWHLIKIENGGMQIMSRE
jgi:3',5'-cyclic AMP phosphodiesterase CpdA